MKRLLIDKCRTEQLMHEMKIIKKCGDIINKYIKFNQLSKVEMSTLFFMNFLSPINL